MSPVKDVLDDVTSPPAGALAQSASASGGAAGPVEVVEIVRSVFETMMGLRARQLSAPWSAAQDRITSAVYLTGDWAGALLIECGRAEACRLAGRFLMMDEPPDLDDSVRDVMGELANMIGGNFKCVMTTGIKLSIPSVFDGGSNAVRLCGAQVATRLSFECEDGPFWVTVVSTGM